MTAPLQFARSLASLVGVHDPLALALVPARHAAAVVPPALCLVAAAVILSVPALRRNRSFRITVAPYLVMAALSAGFFAYTIREATTDAATLRSALLSPNPEITITYRPMTSSGLWVTVQAIQRGVPRHEQLFGREVPYPDAINGDVVARVDMPLVNALAASAVLRHEGIPFAPRTEAP